MPRLLDPLSRSADTTEQPAGPRPVRRRARTGRSLRGAPMVVLAALATLHFVGPQRPLLSAPAPFAPLVTALGAPAVRVASSSDEGDVALRMRFALPGESVRVPLTVYGDLDSLRYGWLRVADSAVAAAARPLAGVEALVVPAAPGFYRLSVERAGERRIVDDLVVAVLVPFSEKRGATLHGFRLGTYIGERLGAATRAALPEGFFPVDSSMLALPLSEHLTLRDVLTTPDVPSRGYPKYAALDPRLVEKLELVLREVERLAGTAAGQPTPLLTVNSGFRPPSYNRTVSGAAADSRHQYGDAADVRVDVNHDGHFSVAELRLVERAVAAVERAHPDLAGGLGLYTSRRYRSPYVHIDARGRTARWTG